MIDIQLTEDQEMVYQEFIKYIMDPDEEEFIISGFAGTGKSTLVTKLLAELPDLLKTIQLLSKDKDKVPFTETLLTATTNKAADALRQITAMSVTTIHSLLGLSVRTDYKSNQSTVSDQYAKEVEDAIIFIDESSYVDQQLLKFIREYCIRCKIIYIGDPAQLAPVNCKYPPVFSSDINEARLEKIVRQAENNPIIELSSMLRGVVNGEVYKPFTPDGTAILHTDRDTFNKMVISDMSDPNWHFYSSKVLAWRNKTVVKANQMVREAVHGEPDLQAGDYAVNNKHYRTNGYKIATDQLVEVTSITPHTLTGTVDANAGITYSIDGFKVIVDNKVHAFLPGNREEVKEINKAARKAGNYELVRKVEETWIDLRASYACTVNKSQGSTFDRVYIDLDDISACRQPNTVARMLYVAVSRARYSIVLTGDII